MRKLPVTIKAAIWTGVATVAAASIAIIPSLKSPPKDPLDLPVEERPIQEEPWEAPSSEELDRIADLPGVDPKSLPAKDRPVMVALKSEDLRALDRINRSTGRGLELVQFKLAKDKCFYEEDKEDATSNSAPPSFSPSSDWQDVLSVQANADPDPYDGEISKLVRNLPAKKRAEYFNKLCPVFELTIFNAGSRSAVLTSVDILLCEKDLIGGSTQDAAKPEMIPVLHRYRIAMPDEAGIHERQLDPMKLPADAAARLEFQFEPSPEMLREEEPAQCIHCLRLRLHFDGGRTLTTRQFWLSL